MNIDELKSLLNNKKNDLVAKKGTSFLAGDLKSVLELEKEIEELDIIISKLET